MLDTMNPKLKDAYGSNTELLRETYDSVFRTGKIEPARTGRKKNKKTTKTIVFHNKYDTSWEGRKFKGTLAINANPNRLEKLSKFARSNLEIQN